MRPDPAPIACVLLAAGLSRRFGDDPPKQLAPWNGVPLARHLATVALDAGLAPVVAVLGHRGDEVAAALAGLEVTLTRNPKHALGLSTSVRAGLAAVPDTAAGALFLPVDLPRLGPEPLRRIVEAFHHHRPPAAAPAIDGDLRAPALFGRELFDELGRVQGDAGGRHILRHLGDRLLRVPFEDSTSFDDADTPEALARLAAEPSSVRGTR